MIIDTNSVVIPTWTELETLDYLARLADRSEFAVESGTYYGASARAMLANSKQLHLWCVDKFMVFGSEGITRLFLGEWIAQGRCEIIVGDSVRALSMLPHVVGKLDFVFCDDGHAEEDLRRDIRCLWPLVKPGGLMLGHDWDGDNDVARGVLSMFSREQITFPRPRLWQVSKPF